MPILVIWPYIHQPDFQTSKPPRVIQTVGRRAVSIRLHIRIIPHERRCIPQDIRATGPPPEHHARHADAKQQCRRHDEDGQPPHVARVDVDCVRNLCGGVLREDCAGSRAVYYGSGTVIDHAGDVGHRGGPEAAGPEGPGSHACEPVGIDDGGEAAGEFVDWGPSGYVSTL